jgi:predicted PurR-regulated permease PerM
MTHSSARSLTPWIIAGTCLLALGMLVQALQPILMPFIIGMLVAYLLDPLADKLEASGLSRNLATALLTVGFFLALVGIVLWLGPLLFTQLLELVRALPEVIESAQKVMNHQLAQVGNLLENSPIAIPADVSSLATGISANAADAALGVLKNIAQSGGALLNVLSLLMITPVVCFYFIRDWDNLVAHVNRLLPGRYAQTIREQARIIDQTLSAYLRGQTHVMLLLAAYYALALSIIGVPYALIIGVISGLLILIPYVGTLVSNALAVGVAYAHFPELTPVMITFSVYVFGQVVESQLLVPKLIGAQVGLHPLWVLFGLLAGGTLFGFVGVLIAVPATAVIGVLVKCALLHYQRTAFYGKTPHDS